MDSEVRHAGVTVAAIVRRFTLAHAIGDAHLKRDTDARVWTPIRFAASCRAIALGHRQLAEHRLAAIRLRFARITNDGATCRH